MRVLRAKYLATAMSNALPNSPPAAAAQPRKFIAYLALVALLVLLDQLGKTVAQAYLLNRPDAEILPFLSFTLVYNEGAAFGFLGDAGGWQRHFLAVFSAAVSVFLLGWLWRSHRNNALLSFALALILGGAIGNLIDRALHQHVVDFILLHYRHWHFPVFNIADIAITFGAVGLVYDSLR